MQAAESAKEAIRSVKCGVLMVVYCRVVAKAWIREGLREAIQPVRRPARE